MINSLSEGEKNSLKIDNKSENIHINYILDIKIRIIHIKYKGMYRKTYELHKCINVA